MLFRVEYVLRDVRVSQSESLEFIEESPRAAKLVIRRTAEDGLKAGACLAVLETEEDVSERVRPHFDISSPVHQSVSEIDRRITVRLSDFLLRTIGVLRWRLGETGHTKPSTRGLRWSETGQDWKLVPGAIRLIIEPGIPFQRMNADVRLAVTEMVQRGTSEPAAHELFREAWSQRHDLPRSSLMIGITAAEVGFKAFVADLVPNAEWLAMNTPTPPLVQMLTDYLPLLPVSRRVGASPFVPTKVVDTIKKGVSLRNKTAHKGEGVKGDTLKEILNAVHDLLYLLDFYAGHTWALEAVSYETQQLLKAESHEP